MMRAFVRGKRTSTDCFETREIQVERRAAKNSNGVLQALVNVGVYLLLFLLFFRDNLQYMGLFLAFMVASVLTQLILRFGNSVRLSWRFPFLRLVGEKTLYRAYLDGVEQKVDTARKEYEHYLTQNLCLASELGGIVAAQDPRLYCRLPIHKDFLTVCLGQAQQACPVTMRYPTGSYRDQDPVLKAFRARVEKKISGSSSRPLPYGCPLREKRITALANQQLDPEVFLEVVNGLILDLAVFQSPEELTLCVIFDPFWNLNWTRFLPHVWRENQRLLFCGSESEQDFTALLTRALEEPSRQIVVVADADFSRQYGFYALLNSETLPPNFCVLFFSRSGIVPTRAGYQVRCLLAGDGVRGNDGTHFIQMSRISLEESERTAKALFRTRLMDNHLVRHTGIPDQVTFFELFSVKRAAQLPQARAEENVAIQSCFPVAVGVGEQGDTVSLDLTNDGDGNHCLVTGTSGSGKSEFVLTYVLSACARYSPEYFAFVVIDFKGGSMSHLICDLPHCCGEFANTGGEVHRTEVTRIARLLESEISSRERLLNEAGCHNDLTKYHRMYAAGQVKAALPRLLIVVDEVAVFFDKDRRAAEYITHIATVGRSVGMILLLATQSRSGVIPAQVRANLNVYVEFYAQDAGQKDPEKRKGRASIRSNRRSGMWCQAALSSVYDSNAVPVDFLSLSGKSRKVRGNEQVTQLQQVREEIQRRYPFSRYEGRVAEVLTSPLDVCIGARLDLETLQQAYQQEPLEVWSCPVGVADNIYDRRRDAFTFTPGQYNLLVYGRPQSGKTTFIQTLLVSLFHRTYGKRPDEIGVYLAVKNPAEYQAYRFPHIGGIVGEKGLYYLLLFLVREIHYRSQAGNSARFTPLVVILDDCYQSIQQSTELSSMFSYLTSESVKYGISVILALPFRAAIGNASLKNFGSIMAFYMGDDFNYATLQMHLDAITSIPEKKGRCLAAMTGDGQRTLEVQIAVPCIGGEGEIAALAQRYCELWGDKERPCPIPVMPQTVALPAVAGGVTIPVGMARDLTVCSWNLEMSNTYLVSYFAERDAVCFIHYLINAAQAAGLRVVVADNQRGSLMDLQQNRHITYYSYGSTEALRSELEQLARCPAAPSHRTMVVLFEYVRWLFPAGRAENSLIQALNTVIQDRNAGVSGVFADLKDFINSARTSGTRLGQYLEGVNSGMLIGNSPGSHTFGAAGLSVEDQFNPLDPGWGVHVSPDSAQVKRVRLAQEVRP